MTERKTNPLFDIRPTNLRVSVREAARQLTALRARVEEFEEDRQRLESDTTRSASYIAEGVEFARRTAFDDLGDYRRKLLELASVATKERELWARPAPAVEPRAIQRRRRRPIP